ncbi:MAG: hypothetical protein ACYCW6_00055 [Candidatus Xenobia bacterium]
MASHMYDIATLKLNDGTISWSSSTIKAALVNANYVYSSAHTNMTQVTGVSGELTVSGYSRQTLASKTETEVGASHYTALSAGNVTWASLATGDTAVAVLIFYDPGTGDSNTILLGYVALSPSIVTNGGGAIVTWDPTYGIMYLTAS